MEPQFPIAASRTVIDQVLDAGETDSKRIDKLLAEQPNRAAGQVSAEMRRHLCEHPIEKEGDRADEAHLLSPRTLGPAPDLDDHDVLVEVASQYLEEALGCGYSMTAFHDPTGNGRAPDAIGWKELKSVMIDCKASRTNFCPARKRRACKNPAQGVTQFHLYMVPKGLLRTDELPPRWGLIEVEDHRGQVRAFRTKDPPGEWPKR